MSHSLGAAGLAFSLLASVTTAAHAAEAPAVGAEAGAAAMTQELVAAGRFVDPTLEYDASGVRHVVAHTPAVSRFQGGDLWYATDRSGAWMAQRLLEGNGCEASWTQSSLAVDREGNVHIAVADGRPCDTPSVSAGIYYLTDRGREAGDFGTVRQVAPARREGPSLDIVNGRRFLAHATTQLPSARLDPPNPLFLSSGGGDGWQTRRVADRGEAPSLKVDASGRVHIVYTDGNVGRERSLLYMRSRRSGDGFTRPERIPDSKLAYDHTLALDAAGRPQVAWVRGRNVRWSERSGGDWSRPQRVGLGSAPSLDIDASGRSHLVYSSREDGTTALIHQALDGGSGPREVIAAVDARGGADGAVFDGQVSAVWSLGDLRAGLWATPSGTPSDPLELARVEALDRLYGALEYGFGCGVFDERGANDPFEFGALAAIRCERPAGGVRQAALFAFADQASLDEYWSWRIGRIDPVPAERAEACADGDPGLGRWEHGDVVCYVSMDSGEARLRFTDERTQFYGVIDGRSDDIERLHARWLRLRP